MNIRVAILLVLAVLVCVAFIAYFFLRTASTMAPPKENIVTVVAPSLNDSLPGEQDYKNALKIGAAETRITLNGKNQTVQADSVRQVLLRELSGFHGEYLNVILEKGGNRDKVIEVLKGADPSLKIRWFNLN